MLGMDFVDFEGPFFAKQSLVFDVLHDFRVDFHGADSWGTFKVGCDVFLSVLGFDLETFGKLSRQSLVLFFANQAAA